MSSALTTEQQQARERAIDLDRSIAFGEHGLEITNLEQAQRVGVWVIESGFAKGFKKPAEVIVALQMGAELGFSPLQSLQVVHVIDGRPSLAVEAQVAKVESDGAIEPGTKIHYRFEGEGEDLACIVWSFPKGGERIESEPVYLRDFKHLRGRDNWKNYPKRMVKARACGWHVRDFYAASVRNLPTREEVLDMRARRGEPPVPPERDVTPPREPDPLLPKAKEADPEPEDAQIVEPEAKGCEHPEGFAPSTDNPEPHCVQCGEVQPAEGEQQEMLP